METSVAFQKLENLVAKKCATKKLKKYKLFLQIPELDYKLHNFCERNTSHK